MTKITQKGAYVSYEDQLQYDAEGRLVTHVYGNNVTHFSYRNGRMDSIWRDEDPNCYSILKYDKHGNIVKEVRRVPEMDDVFGEYPTGNYIFVEYEYEYGPLTNFGYMTSFDHDSWVNDPWPWEFSAHREG